MSKKHLNKAGQPYKVLWFGDLVTPSGFGRIGNEVTKRLKARGYDVQGASISYTGFPHDLPYWVWPLGGQDIWNGLVQIVQAYQPDVLISCQDFPYHQQIWQGCRIDFSRLKWVWITPIDGTPVHPDWVTLGQWADGKMVISRFGQEALRQAGQRVSLCHPGVDTGEFYPASEAERAELRGKAGYTPDAYLVGVMCMNQGRKAIPPMIDAFHRFALDKPEARLYLDMDKVSPAGWDIPALLRQMGWPECDQAKVLYREDLFKRDFAAFAPLRNRYALLDVHMVISHREGFGLPLLESQACRVPAMALDWCSGPEICGDGRGVVVQRIEYMEHGTWGGARDAFPDMSNFVAQLEQLYEQPAWRAQLAETGYAWAVQQTWDRAADQVEDVIQSALARERKEPPSHEPTRNPAPGLTDTYGPGYAVRGDSVLQPPAPAAAAAEEPGADGRGGGPGGAPADSGSG